MGKKKETRPGIIYKSVLASCRKRAIPPQLTAGFQEKSKVLSMG